MTSVKDFEVARAPSADGLGRGRFVFSDRYSVFDWGEMPDRVPGKGASLCTMGADNFERLESAGIPTHYRGVVAGGEAVSLDDYDREAAPTEMEIDLVNVPELPREGRSYDYDAYHAAAGDYFLVPLEVVFRNAVPEGSSLRRRTEPADHGLGFEEWPDGEVTLEEPIVEFSTKYEDGDRYLSRAEAAEIAGAAGLTDLERIAREVNRVITERALEVGFRHQDGKIECLYAGGEVRVADVAGTFDENRFTYEGAQISKEVLREHYRRTQPEWVEAVSEAKAAADERGVGDWKALCEVDPDPLPREAVDAASGLYGAGANRYTGRPLLEAPPLDEAVAAVQELLA